MSKEASAYTGIVESDYKGMEFPEEVENILLNASVLFAHNAEFDRRMLTQLFPYLAQTRWGCTQNDVDWRKLKISSKALEFILYKYGYFYDAHDATVDTYAVYMLLLQENNFKQIKKAATQDNTKIVVSGNTYPNKDALYQLGYRFNYENKSFELVCKNKEVSQHTEKLLFPGIQVNTCIWSAKTRYR